MSCLVFPPYSLLSGCLSVCLQAGVSLTMCQISRFTHSFNSLSLCLCLCLSLSVSVSLFVSVSLSLSFARSCLSTYRSTYRFCLLCHCFSINVFRLFVSLLLFLLPISLPPASLILSVCLSPPHLSLYFFRFSFSYITTSQAYYTCFGILEKKKNNQTPHNYNHHQNNNKLLCTLT